MLGSTFVTVLVGPRALLREGLARILGTSGFNIVAAASSVDDVELSSLPQDQPILLILDVSDDEIATARQIRLFGEQHPNARIALLADHDQLSDSNVVAAFEAGAHAYFTKPTCAAFIKSLELVMLGETILPPAIMSTMRRCHEEAMASHCRKSAEVLKEVESNYVPRLSAREICILRGLIEGDANKVIARNNAIAEATVKVHVKAILRKIRVNNRTQAAIWGMLNDRWVDGMTNGPAPATNMTTAKPSLRPGIALTRTDMSRIEPACSPISVQHLGTGNGAYADAKPGDPIPPQPMG